MHEQVFVRKKNIANLILEHNAIENLYIAELFQKISMSHNSLPHHVEFTEHAWKRGAPQCTSKNSCIFSLQQGFVLTDSLC